MAKPWKKQWPYVTKAGKKSYRVGFRDHHGVERTKAFSSAIAASEWMRDYVSAERRGSHSLRRFLLDLDAKDASNAAAQTIGDVIQLYLAFNAPDTADGLAVTTFRGYRHVATRHLLGVTTTYNGKPNPPPAYAVLSWSAKSKLVPDINSNGCLFANDKTSNRRRSIRAAAGHRSGRRQGDQI